MAISLYGEKFLIKMLAAARCIRIVKLPIKRNP
jgi:hypothetical protein